MRTAGTLPYNSFQDCRHRPLGHSSGIFADAKISFFAEVRKCRGGRMIKSGAQGGEARAQPPAEHAQGGDASAQPLAQRAHGVEDGEDGDADVGEDGEAHGGDAENGEDEHGEFDADCKPHVFAGDAERAAGAADGEGHL